MMRLIGVFVAVRTENYRGYSRTEQRERFFHYGKWRCYRVRRLKI